MATQVHSPSHPAFWRRVLNILRGEGLRGIIERIKARRKTDFKYLGMHLIDCPIDEQAPSNPLGLRVSLVSQDEPGILSEIAQIYGPPYTEQMIADRWKQQGLLCFLGRVNGEAVGCVWVNPGGAVIEFNKPVMQLAPDEVYYKDAWVKPEWRGKNIYPLIKTISGQMLREQYGKKRVLSAVLYSNKPSLNASRKLGGRKVGHLTHLKVFKRKITFVVRTPSRPL